MVVFHLKAPVSLQVAGTTRRRKSQSPAMSWHSTTCGISRIQHLPKRKAPPALFFMCDESWAMALDDAMRRASTGFRPGFSLPRVLRTVLEAAPGCVLISVIAPDFVSKHPADLIALAITVASATRLPILPTVVIAVTGAGLLRHVMP
jgi:uncharacterized membrane protein